MRFSNLRTLLKEAALGGIDFTIIVIGTTSNPRKCVT